MPGFCRVSTRPLMTPSECQVVIGSTLEAVNADLKDNRLVGFKPRPHMKPLFRALETSGANRNDVYEWRPRADSNRRSPP
jgi:hypothetical protein